MKRFIRKRWLGIPVVLLVAVLVVALTAGGVFAAYSFTSLNVAVNVDEPLQVQYKLDYVVYDTQSPGGRTDSTGWQPVDSSVTIQAYFSAGDAQTLYLRMNNRANSPLTVSTVITGNTGQFVYASSDFPQSEVIPKSNGYDFGSNTVNDATAAEWASGAIPLAIKGDASPGVYTLNIGFTRQ